MLNLGLLVLMVLSGTQWSIVNNYYAPGKYGREAQARVILISPAPESRPVIAGGS